MSKVFVVSEAGINHLGDRAKMLALCDAAKAAGADAVKFQAYNAWALMARRGQLRPLTEAERAQRKQYGYFDWGPLDDVPKDEHKGTYALLSKAQLSDADLDAIAAHCKAIGIKWFASVFDPSQVERVLSRGACALKIGHAEADWRELRMACHDKGVPFFISVPSKHMDNPDPYSWREDEYACSTVPLDWGDCVPGQLVYCIAEYPANSPPRLRRTLTGFSSHYTDYRIPAAAALRGAEYIEAHLKLSDTDPEAAWSLSVEDFSKMVKLIREYEGWL